MSERKRRATSGFSVEEIERERERESEKKSCKTKEFHRAPNTMESSPASHLGRLGAQALVGPRLGLSMAIVVLLLAQSVSCIRVADSSELGASLQRVSSLAGPPWKLHLSN